ncbi:MAG: transglutaminase-like domain-containing protein [Bacteriovorax sp.]|nr:transglutaminase-like domain-containing protein [Bacteriovorax sp.]
MENNCHKHNKNIARLISFILISYSHIILARPSDESLYNLSTNKYRDITPQSIIEGSTSVGGIQPDYIADFENIAFDPIRAYAKEIKKSNKSLTEKIESISNFIADNILKNKSYSNKEYLDLVKQYREKGIDIPLSEYIRISGGVCREHALITHYALKEAGIANTYLYVTAQLGEHVEDHAVNIIEYKNEKWIIDSYNKRFNGLKLKDVLNGLDNPKDELFGHDSSGKFRKFIKFNNHPEVWFPRDEFKNKIPSSVYLLREKNQLGKMIFPRDCSKIYSSLVK